MALTARQAARVKARQKAGYKSLEDVARRVRWSYEYLRRIERQGKATWQVAENLSQLYRCDPLLFL